MSSTGGKPALRPPPPGDNDLQHLYDEVWQIFDTEFSSQDAAPAASPSSAYQRDANGLADGRTVPSPSLTSHSRSYSPAVSTSVHSGYSDSSRSPLDSSVSQSSAQRRVRPLPQLPPGSAGSTPMPEPHPYAQSPVSASARQSTASRDSSHLSTQTMPSASVYPTSRTPITSPAVMANNPLPAIPPSEVQTQYRKPGQTASYPGAGYTETFTNGRPGYGSSYDFSQQNFATRPPGALAPTIPGQNDAYNDALLNSGNAAVPGHHSRNSEQNYHFADSNGHPQYWSQPAPPGPSVMIRPNGESRTVSLDQMRYPTLSQDLASRYALDTSSVERATSIGSTNSSFQNGSLGRNPSTPATTYTDFKDYADGTASSVSALNRNDSAVSMDSAITGASTAQYSKRQESYQDHAGGFAESADLVARRNKGYERNVAAVKSSVVEEEYEEEEEEDFYSESDDPDPDRFVNFALLSHIAVRLRDKVPRGTHVKSSIPYPRAFTGKDIVSTIQSQIQRELLVNHGISTADRRAALQVARSLQRQLFFYEVEWGDRPLQDGVEDVYMFLDDQEGGSDASPEREELPTAVITMLTRCYRISCNENEPCYSYSCPRKQALQMIEAAPAAETEVPHSGEWSSTVDPAILKTLPESEVHRQTIIHKTISQEEQYVQDLDLVETLYINPLRRANPPVLRSSELEDFIDAVFGNILDLRACNRRLLEAMYVRQREQAPIIQRIGDVFLEAATEFRWAYPTYVGQLPLAEKRLKEEVEKNAELRLFLEECSRQSAKQQESRRLDLKHFLTRPSEHLQKYPLALEAIMNETTEGNPDTDYLSEAIQAIKNLQGVAQLRTFQSSMGRGLAEKWEWHDLVPKDVMQSMPKSEIKRQSIIFELIKGEMSYVKDLENIEQMYIRPLRESDTPIIPRDRQNAFISDVFHNVAELYAHHRKLLDQFHEIQREEHPEIRSITAPMYDAALNFRDSYMEYIPNYPIAAYRIDDEMANNPAFKAFVEQCTRLPEANRLDMKNFINRPIPRLLRYELLLKGILDEAPAEHEDREVIPQVLELIKALGKESEPGVQSAKQKVQLWMYNANLVFKQGEMVDMDLLDENRSLIHAGKLLRQPDTGFEWNGWTELFVLLFDNYLVMTKPKEKDGITKYHVNRRPIPLDLITLASFSDPPTQRSTGILRLGLGGGRHGDVSAGPTTPGGNQPESAADSRAVYPLTVHYNGRLGGLHTLFSETPQARVEWKQKLEEAIGLRKVIQESNKVFEMETLSADTFLAPSIGSSTSAPSWNHEGSFTGRVTCSVPFMTPDGRGLVAIGCAEGVWIGFRHDSKSMRRVLHLKMVTQCAMLEDFGIFLVLADKSLFAYHIEALVPSSPQSANTSQTPQKLNGARDVHFFSVGNLGGRTLVIYMKKKNLDSIFRVLEPVVGKINEGSKTTQSFTSRFGIRSTRSEWFRVYREFFLPSESFDLIFLKTRIAIFCTRGFEIMDLTDFRSVTIPLRDDARYEKMAKRCESCKPIGMFRHEEEFLLCYDEFGVFVDKHGEPSRLSANVPVTIEWEGTAERAALHWPYVLLFDSRFIEVRHVATGRLAQIIPGNEIRCLWDGRGSSNVNAALSPGGADGFHEGISLDPRIHAVTNVTEPIAASGTGARARAIAQHVFELTPTVPLFQPGSLASPSTSMYFAQSSSPPRSPRLNPSASWR